MGLDLLPASILSLWEVIERRHAGAILATDFPEQWRDLIGVLEEFRLPRSSIEADGGNKSPIAREIDGLFFKRGWVEKPFDVTIRIDDRNHHTPTHKIDYFKGGIAVETEWNNKDPFYDRDLNNFRLLFDIGAVDVGIIITRSWELQEIFKKLGKAKSYGKNTTHIGKLMPRIESNIGGGCPLLIFGITKKLYVDDGPVVPGATVIQTGSETVVDVLNDDWMDDSDDL
jgi:hypothetical protein